mmetsp:Transcript_4993/g.15163  ORF Transcript_4993/g.15163 Transcript_4993/m.15163 type:complete len:287 (+) Transcript_4993:2-862(+)
MTTLLQKSTTVRALIRRELDRSRMMPIRPLELVEDHEPNAVSLNPTPECAVPHDVDTGSPTRTTLCSESTLDALLATPEDEEEYECDFSENDIDHVDDVEPLYEMRPHEAEGGPMPTRGQRKMLAATALQSAMVDSINQLTHLDSQLTHLQSAGGAVDSPVRRLEREIVAQTAQIDGLESQLRGLHSDTGTPAPATQSAAMVDAMASPMVQAPEPSTAELQQEIVELRTRLAREEAQKEQLLERVIHLRMRDLQAQQPRSRRKTVFRRVFGKRASHGQKSVHSACV